MPTGLFHSDPMQDQVVARQHVQRACNLWNTVLLPKSPRVRASGLTLVAHNPLLFACVAEGQKLFNAGFFPNPPGGFKRVAAFMVLARRANFFRFKNPAGKDAIMAPEEEECWRVRALSLMILPLLASTVVTVHATSAQTAEIILDKWNGYPSRHFKAEFFHWLRSLGYLRGNVTDLTITSSILACSLQIEACYYLGAQAIDRNGICGKDHGCIVKSPEHVAVDLDFERLDT
jgi:hypothetical protein